MRNEYVPIISNILKQFDSYRESTDFYNDLSWEGLHQFLTNSEIERVLKTIKEARSRNIKCEN